MKTLIVERPWGEFDQFTQNENSTVKLISINEKSSLSLQYHNHRTEFWYIISGFPVVTIGKEKINAKPGDEFFIQEKELHQIEAQDGAVKFLEVACGDFNEEDIVRVEDKYGRA